MTDFDMYGILDEPEQSDAQFVIDVMEEWFVAIEDGSANLRYPDPLGVRYTEVEADAFVKLVDDFYEDEVVGHYSYWQSIGLKSKGKSIDATPDFKRLEGASREAFMQDIKKRVKEVYGGA